MGVDAAARRADHPERHQSASLRDAEGDHGGEEERDPQGGGARLRLAEAEDREPLRSREGEEDPDHQRLAGRSREGAGKAATRRGTSDSVKTGTGTRRGCGPAASEKKRTRT